ncbi:helix-turn-helix domain-containing protein [Legionella pneumophila]|uniref:helix-turn-helix domain-containing protein n=1 Tax=Legionella pneumophila TaxID=446 RepID=UPI001EDEC28F|nr:helix-turn-helix transcriptional regulator [Legionella pneumophila]
MKKIIGSRITQARKANGLTIKVLAERTGLGAARISNWEQGTRSPGPEEAKSLSKVLCVAASWLLCISDDPRGEWIEQAILKK